VNSQSLFIVEDWHQRKRIQTQMETLKCHACPKRCEQYEDMHHRTMMQDRTVELQYALSDDNLLLMPGMSCILVC